MEGAFARLAGESRRVYFDVGPFLDELQRDRVDEALRLVNVLLLTEDEIAFVAHDLRDLQRHTLADCGTIANAMGAASVARAGAGRNVPSRAELQALLDANRRRIDLSC